MAGLFGLSTLNMGIGDLRETLYRGTSYQRHLGQEHAGLASADRTRLFCDNAAGFFLANFSNRMRDFQGTEGKELEV